MQWGISSTSSKLGCFHIGCTFLFQFLSLVLLEAKPPVIWCKALQGWRGWCRKFWNLRRLSKLKTFKAFLLLEIESSKMPACSGTLQFQTSAILNWILKLGEVFGNAIGIKCISKTIKDIIFLMLIFILMFSGSISSMDNNKFITTFITWYPGEGEPFVILNDTYS